MKVLWGKQDTDIRTQGELYYNYFIEVEKKTKNVNGPWRTNRNMKVCTKFGNKIYTKNVRLPKTESRVRFSETGR